MWRYYKLGKTSSIKSYNQKQYWNKPNFFAVFLFHIYRNAASRGDIADFIPVKGDVEMDLDINEEMKRDQEEAMRNSMNS